MNPSFRAWHKGKKEMFSVEHLQWKNGTLTHVTRFVEFEVGQRSLPVNEVKNIVIMQSTGLRVGWDEDGPFIYEGDLIKFGPKETDIYRVDYMPRNAAFIATNLKDDKDSKYLGTYTNYETIIIGNVYEDEGKY